MATQEQLILAQVGAKSSDIFKDKIDTGSGFVQDLTAGVMGAQAFDESTYALEGAVKDFRKDYLRNEVEEDSLMGRIGLKAFGPNVKMSDLTAEQRREIKFGPQLEARSALPRFDEFKFDTNIYKNLVNDFKSGTSNVVLNNNAQMTEQPFEKKVDNFVGTQYNLDGTPMNTGRTI